MKGSACIRKRNKALGYQGAQKTAGLAFQSAPVTEGTVRDNLLLAEKLHGRSTIPLKSSQILQTFRAGFWIGMQKNYPEVSGRSSH